MRLIDHLEAPSNFFTETFFLPEHILKARWIVDMEFSNCEASSFKFFFQGGL